jgi:hypothetical protein
MERDPNGLAPNTPGAKLDAGKPRVWLMLAGFSRAMEAVAKVTTFGANKYTPNGWMDVPEGVERYMDAFGRHALALGTGHRVDAQSQCLHKAQMIWNLLASLELELREEAAGDNVSIGGGAAPAAGAAPGEDEQPVSFRDPGRVVLRDGIGPLGRVQVSTYSAGAVVTSTSTVSEAESLAALEVAGRAAGSCCAG